MNSRIPVEASDRISSRTEERAESEIIVDPETAWVGYSIGENQRVADHLLAIDAPEDRRSTVLDGFLAVAATAAAAASAVWFGGAPTGDAQVDAVYLVLFGAMVAFCAQAAGRLARVAALVPLLLLPGLWLLLGAASAALVVVGAVRPSLYRLSSALFGPTVVIAYLHLADNGIPRLSAAAAGVGTVLLVVSAIRTTRGRVRGGLEIVTMSVLFVLLFGAVNLASVAYRAKPDLDTAAAAVDRGLGSTDARSIEGASADIVDARRHLVSARSSIDSTWARTGRLVPIVAQNHRALVASLDAIERSTIAAARAVESVDVTAIRSESGGVDVAALERAEVEARELRDVLSASAVVFDAQRGPWLVPQLVDQLVEGSAQSRDAIAELDSQLARLEVLPQLLGADQPRSYLVLVANPSETRDLGGFTGGFAVVRVDGGALELVQSGRSTDLVAIDEAPPVDGVVPDRFRDYEPWVYAQNYTGTPDLTVAANTIREVFPAMGGTEIDGVIYLDPFALGALTELTGPVTIEALGLELDAQSLPQFLLVDQYSLIDDRSARTSVLDVVAAEVFEQLQFGGLPSMGNIIDTMSPLVAQGRLRMVTFDTSETDVLTDLGLTQRFRQESFDDFLAVMHSNAGPNKLDPYLHRSVSYDVSVPLAGTSEEDSSSAQATAVLQVALENRAPGGLPEYVTTNRWNLDEATNRLLLVVHSPLHATVASVDGNLVEVDSYYEFGLWRHEMFVAVPQGETKTVEIELEGRFGVGMVDDDPETHELWVHHQPTVNNDPYVVTVNGASQDLLLTESQRLLWSD